MNKENYEVYNPDDNLTSEECKEIIRKSYSNSTNPLITNPPLLNNINSTINNNNSINEIIIDKEKQKYDYYICPFIGFNCNPKLCQWTVQSCTGCSKAWMNPLRSIKRVFKCFPLDSKNELENYAECSCCLCPCAVCVDTCIVCIYCGSIFNF